VKKMSRADKRGSLKKVYRELYAEVSRLINLADPIGLMAFHAPRDEYDVEVSMILPRLREAGSMEDVHRIIHEEFVRCFGAETAGPADLYAAVSGEIWKVWQRCAIGPDKPAPDDGEGGSA